MARAREVIVANVKSARKKGSVLDRLKAAEAHDVLRRLITAHPNLGAEAETIARSLLAEVTFEAVADDVEDGVRAMDLEDLNGRAGRHEWGYVGPDEAAWEILEETVEPFLDDIKRQIELGLEAEALEICKGLVLGLYRVEHEERGEVAEWAPDFPAEAAGGAIETWQREMQTTKAARAGARRSRPTFPQEFVDRFIPEWRDMIAQIVSRKS